jgi:Leucine Rich Repeat
MSNRNTYDLPDEESQPQAPLPHDTTAVRKQQVPVLDSEIDHVHRRYAAYWLWFFVVLIVAVVLGVVCSGGGGGGTFFGASSTDARSEAIAAFINSITLTSKSIAYPPRVNSIATAEEQALQWLIDEDPLNLTALDRFRLQQRYALLTLWFRTTRISNWTYSMGWLTAENECKAFGITCIEKQVDVGGIGELQTVVEEIDLYSNNLHGGIPTDFGLLENLKYLDLSYNVLSGSLPDSIGEWTALEAFGTHGNAMTGTLPESIGQWSNLLGFDISGNSCNGTLPELIGSWNRLEIFSVDGNALTGTIPTSIENWKNITTFYASNNAFTGTIPKSIENWKNISVASFEGNHFTGSMPTGICAAINVSSGDVLRADCSLECTCCTGCA